MVPLLVSGSAINNVDYTLSSAALRFAAGETTATTQLLLIDDAIFEPQESIDLLMDIPTGAQLGG